MPDSMGKRQRRDVKVKKAAAIEERRVARAQRAADRAAGLIEAGTPIVEAEPEFGEALHQGRALESEPETEK